MTREAELDRVRQCIRTMTAHSFAGTETGAVLDDVLGSAGKMIRPRLLLLCSGFGPLREERFGRICLLAAMVELTHMASLVHDDIVDDARFRRGKPSVQSRYGKDAAVYAGDFLISRVNYWEAKEDLREAAMLLSGTVEKMCVGEIGQAVCRYREDVTAEEYLRNIRGKTAALFQTACLLGAREAGCQDAEAEKLGKIGEYIGIMFQFRDDLLDFISTPEECGKDTRKDFLEGIFTIPVIFAAETKAARESLQAFMRKAKAGTLTESDLRQMTELVLAFGVERTRQEIHRLYRKSIALLDTMEDNESNDRIRELIGKIDAV